MSVRDDADLHDSLPSSGAKKKKPKATGNARSAARAAGHATSAPSDLRPYEDDLLAGPHPPVYDLRKKGKEVIQTVSLQSASVSFSTKLGAAPVWAYDGSVPGPTFIVNPGQVVHVQWQNAIDTPLPFRACVSPDPVGDAVSQNSPGVEPAAAVNQKAAALQACTVTHLHGGRTAADSDGWTENVARVGQSQRTTYENNQRGTLLWYHDHAMGVTRFNVYSGLFGFWVIRDPVEDQLVKAKTLPGEKDELRLLIQDRNFDADAKGNLTGALLHKTEIGTGEMFGPYTLVNGKVWPRCAVGAGPMRLRLLNGSNARTYCLRLVEYLKTNADGTVTYGQDVTDEDGLIWQVGSDGGLLDFPVKLPALGLLLAPAERADLVIDFGRHPGKKLALVNTAFAPFQGATVTTSPGQDPQGKPLPGKPAGSVDNSNRLVHPEVLLFEVGPDAGAAPSPLTDRTPLDPAFRRYVHRSHDSKEPGRPARQETVLPPTHKHRWIALTEYPPGSLFFRGLETFTQSPAVALSAGMPLIAIQGVGGKVTWYRTAAMSFHDAVRIEIPYDCWEVWNFLNLTTDTHPIHVHLVQFQALQRQKYKAMVPPPLAGGAGYSEPGAPLAPDGPPFPVDANEQGFKDTVRVNPGEALSLAAHFDGYCGRYMYHCHILEHEDMDMMRPILVFPADALALMEEGMGGMGGMPM